MPCTKAIIAMETREDRLRSSHQLNDVTDAVEEIRRTNKFILKRIASQEERYKECQAPENESIKTTEKIFERIAELEHKDSEQNKQIQQLMEKIMAASNTLESLSRARDRKSNKEISSNQSQTITVETPEIDREKCQSTVSKSANENSGSPETEQHKFRLNEEQELELKEEAGTQRTLDASKTSNSSIITSKSDYNTLSLSGRTRKSELVCENVEDYQTDAGTPNTVYQEVGAVSDKNRELLPQSDDDAVLPDDIRQEPPSVSNLNETNATVEKTNDINMSTEDKRQIISELNKMQTTRKTKSWERDKELKDERIQISRGKLVGPHYISEKVEEAITAAVQSNLRKGDGINTVFVIDTSESMRGKGINQVRQLFTSILKEMGNVDADHCDNVAVVAFGKDIRVIHHLTNRHHTLIRCLDDVNCEGPSPLAAGLRITHGYIQNQAGVSEDGDVRARVIVMTDGRPTDSQYLDGPENCDMYDKDEINSELISIMRDRKQNVGYCFIPVGDPAMTILETLAAVSEGEIVHPNDAHRIGRMFGNLHKTLRVSGSECMNRGQLGEREDHIDKDITANNQEDIVNPMTSTEMYKHKIARNDTDDNSPNASMRPPIGTRVRRGPDWKWNNQDSNGVGTVVGYYRRSQLIVIWDSNCKTKYNYRYGSFGFFDVVVCDEPRLLGDDLIAVGCLVTRGPDWKYENQDGGDGNIGTVIGIQRRNIVVVSWPNGMTADYGYGHNGRMDLTICDPFNPDVQSKLRNQCKMQKGATAFPEELQTVSPYTVSTLDKTERRHLGYMLHHSTERDKERSSTNKEPEMIYDLAPSNKSSPQGDSSTKNDMKTKQRNLANILRTKQNTEAETKEETVTNEVKCATVDDKGQSYKGCRDLEVQTDFDKRSDSMEDLLSDTQSIISGVSTVLQTTASWEWKSTSGTWTAYADDMNRKIEKAYQKRPTLTILVTINQENYRVVPSKNKQIHIASRNQYDIRRIDTAHDIANLRDVEN